MMEDNNEYIRIDVAGRDERLWTILRHKLIDAISNLLDTEIDPIRHSTLKEEAQRFTSALLDYGKSKLLKPGIENAKTIAEIEELYSQKQKNIAETRKINAEADSIELSNKITKLKFAIYAAKVIMTGDKEKESLLFIKEMDNFLNALNEMERGDASISE